MSTASFGFATQLPVEPPGDQTSIFILLNQSEAIVAMLVVSTVSALICQASPLMLSINGQKSIHWPRMKVKLLVDSANVNPATLGKRRALDDMTALCRVELMCNLERVRPWSNGEVGAQSANQRVGQVLCQRISYMGISS
jgi:hypothetical protein